MTDSFEKWFSSYLDQDESQVTMLLNDKTAIRFLITWSIFESDCFDGFVKFQQLNIYSKKIVNDKNFKRDRFIEALKYFHGRYQNLQAYNNLMYKQYSPKMEKIIKKDIGALTSSDEIFFLIAVVYRYRNNIFHGNKGVSSWLKFGVQIDFCRNIMQELISLAETAHIKESNFAREKLGLDALTCVG